jgi:uncharacterized membrane protein YobD (UPF0266 family)
MRVKVHVKFVYSEKATKFCKTRALLRIYIFYLKSPQKWTMKNLSTFVAFFENTNFDNIELMYNSQLVVVISKGTFLCLIKFSFSEKAKKFMQSSSWF